LSLTPGSVESGTHNINMIGVSNDKSRKPRTVVGITIANNIQTLEGVIYSTYAIKGNKVRSKLERLSHYLE